MNYKGLILKTKLLLNFVHGMYGAKKSKVFEIKSL